MGPPVWNEKKTEEEKGQTKENLETVKVLRKDEALVFLGNG